MLVILNVFLEFHPKWDFKYVILKRLHVCYSKGVVMHVSLKVLHIYHPKWAFFMYVILNDFLEYYPKWDFKYVILKGSSCLSP